MKESFRFVKKEEAIKILENSNTEYVMVSTIDYNTNKLDSIPKCISKNDGRELINNAMSVILNGDNIYPHLDLHSILQYDIRNLRREGIIRSLLLLPKK